MCQRFLSGTTTSWYIHLFLESLLGLILCAQPLVFMIHWQGSQSDPSPFLKSPGGMLHRIWAMHHHACQTSWVPVLPVSQPCALQHSLHSCALQNPCPPVLSDTLTQLCLQRRLHSCFCRDPCTFVPPETLAHPCFLWPLLSFHFQWPLHSIVFRDSGSPGSSVTSVPLVTPELQVTPVMLHLQCLLFLWLPQHLHPSIPESSVTLMYLVNSGLSNPVYSVASVSSVVTSSLVTLVFLGYLGTPKHPESPSDLTAPCKPIASCLT